MRRGAERCMTAVVVGSDPQMTRSEATETCSTELVEVPGLVCH